MHRLSVCSSFSKIGFAGWRRPSHVCGGISVLTSWPTDNSHLTASVGNAPARFRVLSLFGGPPPVGHGAQRALRSVGGSGPQGGRDPAERGQKPKLTPFQPLPQTPTAVPPCGISKRQLCVLPPRVGEVGSHGTAFVPWAIIVWPSKNPRQGELLPWLPQKPRRSSNSRTKIRPPSKEFL